MPQLKLYGYWRSSASYRVRIALALKGLDVTHVPINLKTGAQHSSEFTAKNPQQAVPLLEQSETRHTLGQSLAIMDYLEQLYPTPSLLPQDTYQQAQAKAFAQMICCDIHPLQNLRVLKFLRHQSGFTQAQIESWCRHWIEAGLKSLEFVAAQCTTDFLFNETPGYCECALIPQLYNAKRYKVELTAFPTLMDIETRCARLAAFQTAHPKNQSDAIE